MFKELSKRTFFIPVVFALVAIIGFGVVFGLTRINNKVALNNCQSSDSACINLLGKTADPDTIAITAGTYVQFNSADVAKHNLALTHSSIQHEDQNEYESGDFQKDEAWRVQFKKDGAYSFRDKYHPDIKINVIVYTKGKDYKVQ